MPRKYNIYVPETPSCHITKLISYDGLHQDNWCTRHAKYLCQCWECGQYFHSDRPHNRYCRNAHKQRAYRARQVVNA